MKKNRYATKAYYEAVACKCGGDFSEPVGGFLMSNPMQRKYKCEYCDEVKTLKEDEFPGVKHEIIKAKRD